MLVHEFPGVQVDDFRIRDEHNPPVIYLLTHAHSDHLEGLENKSFRGPPVHCSIATKASVLKIRTKNGTGVLKYPHLSTHGINSSDVLVGLQMDVAHKVRYLGQKYLSITLIDANHCPGSVMFLIQDEDGLAVLVTGDNRFESWHVNALAHHPSLLPFTTCTNKSISIYIDDVYATHSDPFHEYPEYMESTNFLKDALSHCYPAEAPFVAMFTTTGYEKVLIALAAAFDTKIHLDEYYYYLYLSAADSCPTAKNLITHCTPFADQAKIHWCRKGGSCPSRKRQDAVFFSPCTTIKEAAIAERNRIKYLRDYNVGGYCELPVFIDSDTGNRYVLGSDRETLLPGSLLFKFSRHSSRSEVELLLRLFASRVVYSSSGRPLLGLSRINSEPNAIANEPDTTARAEHMGTSSSLALLNKQRPVFESAHPVTVPKKRKLKAPNSSESIDNTEALAFLNKPKTASQKSQGSSVYSCTSSVDELTMLPSPGQSPSACRIEELPDKSELEDVREDLEVRLRSDPELWSQLHFDWKSDQ